MRIPLLSPENNDGYNAKPRYLVAFVGLLLFAGISIKLQTADVADEFAVGTKCSSIIKNCPGSVLGDPQRDCPPTGCTTEACCGSSSAVLSPPVVASVSAPIVVISDIGRDIDDTLAMAVLNAFVKRGVANPVGFVATGWNAETVAKRLGLMQWWVRRLGIGQPLYAGCVSGAKDDHVTLPPGAEADPNFVDDQCQSAAQLIIQLAEQYPGQLEIHAIAGMGALKKALEIKPDLELASVWIQGQFAMQGADFMPLFESYNLKIDEDSSTSVFKQLGTRVPFRLLGKWAAYQTKIQAVDFAELDGIDPSSDILQTALKQINGFRQNVPWLMWSLYPGTWNDNPKYALGNPGFGYLPKSKEQAEKEMGKPYPTDENWCDYLTYISMPYDPCLFLWRFWDGNQIFAPVEQQSGAVKHLGVGNDAANPGVVDTEQASAALFQVLKEGLQGAIQTADASQRKREDMICPQFAPKTTQQKSVAAEEDVRAMEPSSKANPPPALPAGQNSLVSGPKDSPPSPTAKTKHD